MSQILYQPDGSILIEADAFVTTRSQIQAFAKQGVAPFSVYSNTIVANLNVEFLDGYPGSYYLGNVNLPGVQDYDLLRYDINTSEWTNLSVGNNKDLLSTNDQNELEWQTLNDIIGTDPFYIPTANVDTIVINNVFYANTQLGATGQLLTANSSGGIYWGPPASGNVSYIERVYQAYTATLNQTTFTVATGYSVGSIEVFVNGVHLSTSEYTATNGSTVVLNAGVDAGDIVEVSGYDLLGSVLGVAIGTNSPYIGGAKRVAVWDNQVDLGGDADFTWDQLTAVASIVGDLDVQEVYADTLWDKNTSSGATGQMLTADGAGGFYWGPPISGDASYIERIHQNYTVAGPGTQDTFTVGSGYTTGSIDVFVNGVRLANTEYDDTSGTTVILNDPVEAGTEVTVSGYDLDGSVLGAAIGVGASAQRVAVWDNSADIGGDANFTWDGAALEVAGDIVPGADSTYDLGSTSLRWAEIHGDNISNKYDLPNTGTSAGWWKLGTFTAGQTGQIIHIRVVSHNGYNANLGASQNFELDIYFKTSNSTNVDGNGFAGDGQWYAIRGNDTYIQGSSNWSGSPVKFVANAGGTSATSFDVRIYFPTYTNSSFYEVTTSSASTWTHSLASSTDPGAGSSTVCHLTQEYKVLQDILPQTDSALDLGSDTVRWANIYGDNLISNQLTIDGNGEIRVPGKSGINWYESTGPVYETIKEYAYRVYPNSSIGDSDIYFDSGEAVHLFTITPGGNSRNYAINGSCTLTSSNSMETLYFELIVRSNTLPNLTHSLNWWTHENTASGTISPIIWIEDDNITTGGTIKFLIEFTGSDMQTFHTRYTVYQRGSYNDVTIIGEAGHRSSTVDSGYTEYTYEKSYSVDKLGNFYISGDVGVGASSPAGALHVVDATAQAAGDPVVVIGDSTYSYAGATGALLLDSNYHALHIKQHGTSTAIGTLTFKSRGTSSAETTVLNGDLIRQDAFLAYDGTTYATSGYTAATVDTTQRPISTPNVPTKYKIVINDGTTAIAPFTIAPSDTAGTAKTTIAGILEVTGTGITLPNGGTQTTGTASSDVLDWYEEGSFTPAATFDTPGDLSIAYNTGVTKGQYTRIGNSVTVHLRVVTTTFTHTTASGSFQITGLPFASRLNNISYGGSFSKATNITAAASDLLAQPFIPNGDDYISIRYIRANATGSANYNQTNILGTNSGGQQLDYMITITYEAA